jgi:amino acid permease
MVISFRAKTDCIEVARYRAMRAMNIAFGTLFDLIGCLIPAYLVYRVPELHRYKEVSLYIVIATGILLFISPFLAFSQ